MSISDTASSSMIGPALPPKVQSASDVAAKKKKRKERKESGGVASENDSDGESSHAERKRRRKEEKRAKKEAKNQKGTDATSVASAALAATAHEETALDDVLKLKGKGPAQSAFHKVTAIVDLTIPPALTQEPMRAASEMMDTLLMRHVPQFGGVLICHTDISFLKRTATIDADGAFSIVPIRVRGLVWAPQIGIRLEGRVTLSTPSHISLLVHGIFNASITSAHLPSVQEMAQMRNDHGYEWQEYTDVDDVAMQDVDDQDEGGLDGVEGEDGIAEKSTGCWVEQDGDRRLGGEDGSVVFTVVGMTIANNMLSLHGSLLRKPFSIPAPTYVPTAKDQQRAAAAAESSRRVRFQDGHETSEFQRYAAEEEDDEDEDEDEDEDGEENDDDDDDEIAANVIGPTHVRAT